MKKKKVKRVSDIKLPTDYDIRKTGSTQSLISAFPSCRQRYLFVVNRWKPIDGGQVFEFGNIYHEMLDKAYNAYSVPSKAILKRRLKKYQSIREPEFSAISLEHFERQIAMCEMILTEYFKYYADDFTKKVFTECERVFEVDFCGFILRGKKDARFYHQKKKSIHWLMEHKTKGRVDADILESVLNFDFQNLTYITADDLEYDQDMQNVLYNIIRNPGHKQKSGESFLAYVERIRQDIKERPEHYFIRYECPYDTSVKKEFCVELYDMLCEAEKFLQGELPLYKNRNACKMPYRCQYLDACVMGNMSGYCQQDTWFPELR